MSRRPYFAPCKDSTGYDKYLSPEFGWHGGFALSQQQKNVSALHEAIKRMHGAGTRVLEVSTRSLEPLGKSLSAHNLMLSEGVLRGVTVENAFQCSKVYRRMSGEEVYGPYPEYMNNRSKLIKRQIRERLALAMDSTVDTGDKALVDYISGRFSLKAFQVGDKTYSLEPKIAFYALLYCTALHALLKQSPHLWEELCGYDYFTDIAFNPEKSLNCQAAMVCFYITLRRRFGEDVEVLLRDEAAFWEQVKKAKDPYS